MLKTIPVEDAVGMVIPHDITEIVKDTFKGVAFKKGHIIEKKDIAHLKRLGKNKIYVLEIAKDEIHENEVAGILSKVLGGPGIVIPDDPQEGKISFKASHDGLLKINKDLLFQFNMYGEVMCSTLHTNTPVRKGEIVAAARLIPLIAKKKMIDAAISIIAQSPTPMMQIIPIKSSRIGLVITGTEIYSGIIEDKFEGVLRQKISELHSELTCVYFSPDDPEHISRKIKQCLGQGVDLVITSGGMSVDPDDVTRAGIKLAGAEVMAYGTPVLPGAMFLSGRIKGVPILGLPACGMFHKITVFDLILPRVLAGEEIGREELADLGHGGLCRNCKKCQYPICNFGK